MAKEIKNNGIVYLVKNKAFAEKKLVKIGSTSDFKQRINDLSGANVPYAYECIHACYVNQYKDMEKQLQHFFIKNM